MNAEEMLTFFRSLKDISASENGLYRTEMVRLTDHVAGMTNAGKFSPAISKDSVGSHTYWPKQKRAIC